jgi:hypothetical protein
MRAGCAVQRSEKRTQSRQQFKPYAEKTYMSIIESRRRLARLRSLRSNAFWRPIEAENEAVNEIVDDLVEAVVALDERLARLEISPAKAASNESIHPSQRRSAQDQLEPSATRSQLTELPTEPGFYPCVIVEGMHGDVRIPAIVEVCGKPPYLRAFLYANGEAGKIDRFDLKKRLRIGKGPLSIEP